MQKRGEFPLLTSVNLHDTRSAHSGILHLPTTWRDYFFRHRAFGIARTCAFTEIETCSLQFALARLDFNLSATK